MADSEKNKFLCIKKLISKVLLESRVKFQIVQFSRFSELSQ